MKKLLVIILLSSFIRISYASNGCTHENSNAAKELNNEVYSMIYDKRASLDLIDQYMFTSKIFTKILEIKNKSNNDTIKCAISGIGYRLNGDKISYTKNIDTSSTKFKLLPMNIQKNILDSKNSTY